jgi:1,4-alpha-glucan branching enzyme
MTPNFYEGFGIPVEEEGEYEEIFNSDKDIYGGANQYNGATLGSYAGYITIKLASFGAMIFRMKDKEPVKEKVVKKSKK